VPEANSGNLIGSRQVAQIADHFAGYITGPQKTVLHQYFSLVQSAALWDGITQARALGSLVPGEIADPKMEMLIVLS
jgi:hypothetical protein